jgi:hypothetical protein
MSAITKWSSKTVRHSYTIPSPACWTDVKAAMGQAANDREDKGMGNGWDDVIKVIGDDESVTVYWEEVTSA